MKIVFEGSEYQSETLSDLLEYYPEASMLINFINDWQSKKEVFEFKTSGSTGSPKSIDVNREQIVASVQATKQHLNLKSSDQALLCLDPNFVASLMMAARCMVIGMNLILKKPSSHPLRSLKYPIDFASFVPMQIYTMIEGGSIGQLAQIKNILIGGAPLSKSAFEILAKVDTNIYATYGMTETVSHIALLPIKGRYEKGVYKMLPNLSYGQDEDQCLNVTGAVTNFKMVQTNDVVELREKKGFRWLGRRDHVINSGGIKIHPEQLEDLIGKELGSSIDFLISWVENEKLGSECVLLTEKKPISEKDFKNLQTLIQEAYSKYHTPKSVLTLDAFVRTSSGKIQREKTRLEALKLL